MEGVGVDEKKGREEREIPKADKLSLKLLVVGALFFFLVSGVGAT